MALKEKISDQKLDDILAEVSGERTDAHTHKELSSEKAHASKGACGLGVERDGPR